VQSRDTLRVCLVALEEKRERRFTPMTATRMDADGRLKEEGLVCFSTLVRRLNSSAWFTAIPTSPCSQPS